MDHSARLGLLHMLNVLRVLGRGFGHMDRTATDQRTTRHSGGQFRNGHSYRHKRLLSFCFPVAADFGKASVHAPYVMKNAESS
jgi:hypothetical protein